MQAYSTATIEFEVKESRRQVGQDVLVPVDLSSADVIMVRMRNNTLVTVMDRDFDTGLLYLTDGTDGIVRYKFTTDESTPGHWDFQVYVEWTGISSFWSNVRPYTFRANLAAA